VDISEQPVKNLVTFIVQWFSHVTRKKAKGRLANTGEQANHVHKQNAGNTCIIVTELHHLLAITAQSSKEKTAVTSFFNNFGFYQSTFTFTLRKFHTKTAILMMTVNFNPLKQIHTSSLILSGQYIISKLNILAR